MEDKKFCSNCGEKVDIKAEICPKCGVRITGSGSDRSKVVAGILAIFLGGFGIHKFYLGRGGQGVLYLLFCWTFIPAIIALIEGIVYFAMSDEEFKRKYE